VSAAVDEIRDEIRAKQHTVIAMQRRSTWEETASPGFSCPQVGLDEQFLEFVAVEHARAVTRELLGRHADDLQERAPGVRELFGRWAASAASFSTTWHPAFARCHQALMNGEGQSVINDAICLALHLSASVRDAVWRATFHAATRVRWDRWTLAPGNEIDVRVAGATAHISVLSNGIPHSYEFQRTRGKWERVCGETDVFPIVVGVSPRVLLWAPAALAEVDWADGEPSYPCDVPAAEIVASIRSAVAILRRAAPAYWPWVRRVLRGVIPVGGSNLVIRSSSSSDRPGLIGISFPAPPIAIAEMLVHESSHQYFHLLSRLQQPDDGTDTTLYYSPVRRTGRPLRGILVAYHAFANVLLFYRLTKRYRVEDGGYCAREARKLVPQLRELELPLRSSRALTMTGHALWEPLARQLQL